MQTKTILPILLSTMIFLASNINVQAQQDSHNHPPHDKKMSLQEKQNADARISKEKKAYIEKNLSLSKEEADKFWANYDKIEKTRRAERPKFQKRDSLQNLSDAEKLAKAREIIAHKEKILQAEIQYLKELQSILPATKIVELWKIERDFHREIIKSVKGNNPKQDSYTKEKR